MAGKIKEIKAKDFENEVLNGKKVVVDFYSTECPPCEALASKYIMLSELFGNDIKFIKIFRQENRELAESLGVTSSPTLLFYDNGKIIGEKLTGGIKRADIINNFKLLIGEKRTQEIKEQVKPIETVYDVVILGGGPAGLTSAIYLSQAQINAIVIDIAMPGGYVATTHQISNYPGFIEPLQGFMLAHYMHEQAKEAGADFRSAVDVTSVDLEKKEILIDEYETIKAKKIIIATGSSPKPLGIPGEIEYRGNGISYCATCDAKYFKDKEVIVIGGGNSAIEESLFIARFTKKITIIHQFAEFQANKLAQKKLLALGDKIEILFEHEPREFLKHGNMDMEVVAENLKTKEMKKEKANGIFVFVGFIPNIKHFEDKLELDKWGYIKKDNFMKTSMDGVYAVGDVASKRYRQITTAVSDGTIAAIKISEELS